MFVHVTANQINDVFGTQCISCKRLLKFAGSVVANMAGGILSCPSMLIEASVPGRDQTPEAEA